MPVREALIAGRALARWLLQRPALRCRRRRPAWRAGDEGRRLLYTVGTPVLALGLGLGSGWAAEAPSGDVKTYARVVDLLGVERPVDEKALEALARVFGEGQTSGAAAHVARKQVRLLNIRAAALRALEKNLSLKVGREEAERLKVAIQEAEAVFNPVFRVSIGYRQTMSHDRTRHGAVILKTFTPFTEGKDLSVDALGLVASAYPPQDLTVHDTSGVFSFAQGVLILPTRAGATEPQVDILSFVSTGDPAPGDAPDSNAFRARYCPDGYISALKLCLKPVKASKNNLGDPTNTWNYDISVEQQLPWGPAYRISTFTTDRDVFYNRRGDSFDRDFATTLLLEALIPLPGTKDFGPYASADTDLKLREKAAQRADWDLKAIVNSILLESDLAYWSLVRAVENLALVSENRRLVERQAERTQHLFAQGLTTAYGKAVVDAELERLKAVEEQAKAAVIEASNRLALLLEQSGEEADPYLLLPRDYGSLLDKTLLVKPEGAVAQALESRPELAAARISKEESEIALAFRQNQLRPDVKFAAAVTTKQDASKVGYENYWESIRNTIDPDTLVQNYTVTYTYPWRKRVLQAQYGQAEKEDQIRAATVQDTENAVVKDVNDALAGLLAARARADAAAKNVEFAQAAYDKLAQRRESGGEVRELELVTKSQELLAAKQALVNALVDNKVAESRLLAAQGIIASAYGELTARSDFERDRLQALNRKGGLRYFIQLLGLTARKAAAAVPLAEGN